MSIQEYATRYEGCHIAVEVDDALFVANRVRLVVDGTPVDDRAVVLGAVRLHHAAAASSGAPVPIVVEVKISGLTGKVKSAELFTDDGTVSLSQVVRST